MIFQAKTQAKIVSIELGPRGYIAAKEHYHVLEKLVADLQDEREQVKLQGIDVVTSSGNSYHISIDILTMSMIDGKACFESNYN